MQVEIKGKAPDDPRTHAPAPLMDDLISRKQVVAIIRNFADDSLPESEYRLACEDLIEEFCRPAPAPRAVGEKEGE